MGGSDVSRQRAWAAARKQHGVVTHAQMVACGYHEARQVEGVLSRGEALRLHLGVYLLGPTHTIHAQALAAVLACGPGALLSHRTAAYLYRLLPLPAQFQPVDVTVTSGRAGNQSGIRVHDTQLLRPHERRERDGIPITAPLRTLIEFAGCSTDVELEAAVAEAFALRLCNKGTLERAVEEADGEPRHRGVTHDDRGRAATGADPIAAGARPGRPAARRRGRGFRNERSNRPMGGGSSIGAPWGLWSRSTPTPPIHRRGRSSATGARRRRSRT